MLLFILPGPPWYKFTGIWIVGKGARTSVAQLGSEAVLSVHALLGGGYTAWLRRCVYAF